MTETPATLPPETMSFEEALSQLERIVAELESGQAPLEKSLELYKRGAALKALCEERLEAARLQVEKITLTRTGQVEGTAPAEFN
ncbi:exodeoxyribonuclease VII small subunit [Asticcacaulis sp. DW145]|uniref:Exodeoxyribonuclease 7 small subunit n=1 Tax=Asticcacaulis currens TaxID=2984210 RepID=A0ABT5IH06_9CAUL|nr:exodeoxyribonuclease VII small subunit [Asticcacaulis currens]MDC7695476.1 exodeoxyribonuclease VII small subunit [Asticcacaulis currens]BEV10783.1 exodeoxyribonuclease VII small subunit [Asticcacaulis sp. DW145]